MVRGLRGNRFRLLCYWVLMTQQELDNIKQRAMQRSESGKYCVQGDFNEHDCVTDTLKLVNEVDRLKKQVAWLLSSAETP